MVIILNVYRSVSTLSCILWNQILSPYAQETHSFFQALVEEIARRLLKINEEILQGFVPLFLSPSI